MRRLSDVFFRSLRNDPADAPRRGLARLARAGYVHLGASGVAVMPLGFQLLRQIEGKLLEADGASEEEAVRLPESDVLGSLSELTDAVVQSYRDLPRHLVLHSALAPGPAEAQWGGVVSVVRLDAVERTSSSSGMWNWLKAQRWPAVEVVSPPVSSAAGARVLIVEAEDGAAAFLTCEQCGQTALPDAAVRGKAVHTACDSRTGDVATPGATTIAGLIEQAGISAFEVGKTLIFLGERGTRHGGMRMVAAVVRGEMQVSVARLQRATGLQGLRPATDAEMRSRGMVPGYASPAGVQDVLVVVDDVIPRSGGLVMGANREGYHRFDVACGREYAAEIVADIALAEPGDPCGKCGGSLRESRGDIVALRASLDLGEGETASCMFTGDDGARHRVHATWTEVHPGPILTCAAGLWGGDDGLHFPPWMAAGDVHVIALVGGEDAAEALARDLDGRSVRVLLDDRQARAGVKFADADWLGLPLRIVVGPKGVAEGVGELAVWSDGGWQREEIALDGLAAAVVAARGSIM